MRDYAAITAFLQWLDADIKPAAGLTEQQREGAKQLFELLEQLED